MKLIAAVDSNWAIGYRNELLFNISADMQFFKKKTTGQVVVMGRKTFETLPGKKPLPNRINIVISRTAEFTFDNVIVCRSREELLPMLKDFNDREIYVAGGEHVYAQLLPYCSWAYITRVKARRTADRFMVNLDEHKDWELIAVGQEQLSAAGEPFSFLTYHNRKVLAG